MSDSQGLLKNLTPKQLALLVLRMQSKIEDMEQEKSEPIAILGIGCRFPHEATDPDTFWRLLSRGEDAISEVPPARWDIDDYYDPDPSVPGKMATRWGGFLPDVDQFDAAFFGISPREAMYMDPQQRLALEVAWEALEHAGLSIDTLKGSQTGVFVGAVSSDYSFLGSGDPADINTYTGTGTSHSILAGRISYLLDLRGPSVALDTACSSSLVAVHQAAQSLRNRECSLAIAGGVNLILSPSSMIGASQMRMMAADGRCKTFDRRADGFVRGEGCGMVILKRLSAALAAGDPILAVVRGSAVNQDGRSAGLTAPNMQAQQDLLRQVLAQARLHPEQISMIEAHGTGTSLGDPIEVEALKAVFGKPRPPEAPETCWLGSVKTNLGHTEAAAGIAGLIKVVLSLQHEQIPPHLHFESLNPNILLEDTPFTIPTTLHAWPRQPGQPRYAGVSSFGWSGTNAHVIVEEAPVVSDATEHEDPHDHSLFLLPFSARSPQALLALARRYEPFLRDTRHALQAICATASTRRSHQPYRQVLLGHSKEDLLASLQAFLHQQDTAHDQVGEASSVFARQAVKTVFVFPGQGSQWLGMGRELWQQEPVFRQTLHDCEQAMTPYLAWSLTQQLHADEPLQDIDVVQPLLFALHIALARLWMSWGILPAAVMGHSMGEVAAAHIAGLLSLSDAARIICRRSQLLRRLRGTGRMALLEADRSQAQEWIAQDHTRLSIAACNGPRSTIVAGETSAIETLLTRLQAQGIFCRAVPVDVASHSPLVEPLRADLQVALQGITPQPGQFPMYSTVRGRWLQAQDLQASYWVDNLREPVQFWPGVQQVVGEGYSALLEISPHPVLVTAMQEGVQQLQAEVLVLSSLKRQQPERAALLQGIARLYEQGASIDWQKLFPSRKTSVPLPAYPWQHERFWLEESKRSSNALRLRHLTERAVHPLLGVPLDLSTSSSLQRTYIWEAEFMSQKPFYLSEHRVQGMTVLPATAYLEMMQAAAREVFNGQAVIQEVDFRKMLTLFPDQPQTIQVVLHCELSGHATIQIFSRLQQESNSTANWQLHATGSVLATTQQEKWPAANNISTLQARMPTSLSGEEHYQLVRSQGIEYGESFQGIQQLWIGNGEALAALHVPVSLEQDLNAYICHPALLDAAFQVLGEAFAGIAGETGTTFESKTFVPVSLSRLRIAERPTGALWAYAQLKHRSDNAGNSENFEGDLCLLSEDGQCVLEVEGLHLQRIESEERLEERDELANWLYSVRWQLSESLPVVHHAPDRTHVNSGWLILADAGSVGQRIEQAMKEQGEHCVIVRPGERYQRLDDQHFILNPLRLDHFKHLLKDSLDAQQTVYRGIIHLWSLDSVNDGEQRQLDPVDMQPSGYSGVLHLVQAIAQAGWRNAPRLWLITNGVQLPANVPAQDTTHMVISPQLAVQAPLWGMSRVINHEQADLHCSCVDLSPTCERTEIDALFREIWHAGKEDQIMLRDTNRYVARLHHLQHQQPEDIAVDEVAYHLVPAAMTPYRVEASKIGILDSLILREVPSLPLLQAREVKIRVHSAGLNFSDIMKAMGVYPGLPKGYVPLGIECAGTIVAIGDDVEEFRVGDEVIALAPGSLSSDIIVEAAYVVHKPARLSFEEAAGIASVFLTAYYALVVMGRLQKGERILIHSGSGGVGLAAIQFARQIGAEIFVTAGSEEKRAYLRSIGIQHVMDSRSLAFGAEVMAITEGRGVDVVLNSLAGEAIDQNFSILAPLGRFLEIGKKDIYEDRQIGLSYFQRNISYFALDLDGVFRASPEVASRLLREVIQQFATGHLRPLPQRIYPVAEVTDAFRYFAQARHIGKIVLSMQGQNPLIEPHKTELDSVLVRSDSTYLITGGLSGLGLRVAQWLTDQGARYLVLLGRHAPSSMAQQAISDMEAAGTHVYVTRCDVAQSEQLAAVLQTVGHEMPPLRGVIHSAVVLDDGILLKQTPERFQTVMAPKIGGSWNLHQLTQHLPLDFFVLFSTAGTLLGAPGQINYVAANAFLDALAHQRRRLGQPALSINWGPWTEIGLATAQVNRGERLAFRGIASLTPQQGLASFEYLLRHKEVQAAVMSFNARQWGQFYPRTAEIPLIALLELDMQRPDMGMASHPMRQVLEVTSPDQRTAKLAEHLREQISRVLRLDIQRIDQWTPLGNLGFDSLVALELRNRLELSLGLKLSAALVWAHPTIASMTQYLLIQMGQSDNAEVQEETSIVSEPEPPRQVATDADLDTLSEQQMAVLLAEEIADISKRKIN